MASEVPLVNKKDKPTSGIWDYFDFNDHDLLAANQLQNTFKSCVCTTNLFNHIQTGLYANNALEKAHQGVPQHSYPLKTPSAMQPHIC